MGICPHISANLMNWKVIMTAWIMRQLFKISSQTLPPDSWFLPLGWIIIHRNATPLGDYRDPRPHENSNAKGSPNRCMSKSKQRYCFSVKINAPVTAHYTYYSYLSAPHIHNTVWQSWLKCLRGDNGASVKRCSFKNRHSNVKCRFCMDTWQWM
jgi:hypothetical protein